jgi:hypothetical protein
LSRSSEGRLAIVKDVGRDAVDARASARWPSQGGSDKEFVSGQAARRRTALLRTAKSCGLDAPTLASSFVEAIRPYRVDAPIIREATVAKKPGHRREHEGSC